MAQTAPRVRRRPAATPLVALLAVIPAALFLLQASMPVDPTVPPVVVPTDTVIVSGRVTRSDTGEPLANAIVSVSGLDIHALTDDDGRYVLLHVPPGVQTLTMEADGFRMVGRSVDLPESGSVTVDFKTVGTDPRDPPGRVGGVYSVADRMPEIEGGMDALLARIAYPGLAVGAGVEGRVILQFVVDETGRVVDETVIRGIGAGCDEAAIRALRETRFRPGLVDGNPVPVRMAIPILFRLDPPRVQMAAEVPEPGPEVFVIVEQMPELVGGLAELQSRIRYPDQARQAGIEGHVIVQFTVDENGSVRDPVVIRGIGAGCDEEAVRVVSAARFTPGKQRGKPISVRMSLPVTFTLE